MSIELHTTAMAFGVLLLMEMGDKTQLAVLSLTAQTGRPVAVFAGATLGLAAVTLLGVTVGAVAVAILPGSWISIGTGVGFIVLGGMLLWWARGGKRHEDDNTFGGRHQQPLRGALSIVAVTTGLLFLSEMGDKSQVAVIGLAAQSHNPLSVFLGAVAALVLLAVAATLLGRAVARYVPARWFSSGSGALFVAIGFLTLMDP